MAKKTDNRANIELKCAECGFIIRPTEKNRKNTPDKLEIKKYCPKCKKTQNFKEKKQYMKNMHNVVSLWQAECSHPCQSCLEYVNAMLYAKVGLG